MLKPLKKRTRTRKNPKKTNAVKNSRKNLQKNRKKQEKKLQKTNATFYPLEINAKGKLETRRRRKFPKPPKVVKKVSATERKKKNDKQRAFLNTQQKRFIRSVKSFCLSLPNRPFQCQKAAIRLLPVLCNEPLLDNECEFIKSIKRTKRHEGKKAIIVLYTRVRTVTTGLTVSTPFKKGAKKTQQKQSTVVTTIQHYAELDKLRHKISNLSTYEISSLIFSRLKEFINNSTIAELDELIGADEFLIEKIVRELKAA